MYNVHYIGCCFLEQKGGGGGGGGRREEREEGGRGEERMKEVREGENEGGSEGGREGGSEGERREDPHLNLKLKKEVVPFGQQRIYDSTQLHVKNLLQCCPTHKYSKQTTWHMHHACVVHNQPTSGESYRMRTALPNNREMDIPRNTHMYVCTHVWQVTTV